MVEGFFNFHPRVCVRRMGTKIQVATEHKKTLARHGIRLRTQKRERINKQTFVSKIKISGNVYLSVIHLRILVSQSARTPTCNHLYSLEVTPNSS